MAYGIPTKAPKFVEKQRRTALRRFPLLFMLLGAFGFVATFYGFEHIIDQIPWLADNPIVLLGVGLVTLALTGQLHKRLDAR
jgi:hypothetical protein